VLDAQQVGRLRPMVSCRGGATFQFVPPATELTFDEPEISDAEQMLVRLDLAAAAARSLRVGLAPPKALMLAATTDAMAGAGNTWCWGRKGPALKLSGENLVMEKVNSSPDYSTVLGTEGFSSGIHTWEMKIEQDTDGVWVGVTTENCKLDTCIVNQSECRSWLYRPSGKCFRYDRGSQRDGPEGMSFRADDTIRLSLDMHAGKISFMNVSKGEDSKVATLGDVEGPVFPCVCFDYGSKVTILSQSTRGGMSWLAAAEAAWHSGMVATDQIALPGASWTQACDEQLCRVLAQAKPKAPTAAALADLTKFPLISGTATGVLLRRARLISRYSELVTGILPLIDLRGTGLPATAAIGQLRSLILPTHKLKFIERVLTSVRGRVSSSSGHPAFKVSRGREHGGRAEGQVPDTVPSGTASPGAGSLGTAPATKTRYRLVLPQLPPHQGAGSLGTT